MFGASHGCRLSPHLNADVQVRKQINHENVGVRDTTHEQHQIRQVVSWNIQSSGHGLDEITVEQSSLDAIDDLSIQQTHLQRAQRAGHSYGALIPNSMHADPTLSSLESGSIARISCEEHEPGFKLVGHPLQTLDILGSDHICLEASLVLTGRTCLPVRQSAEHHSKVTETR